MRVLAIFAIIIIALSITTPSLAEEGFGSTAVVNIKKILKESKATKGIQKDIEAKKKTVQAEVSKKEEKLRAEDKKLAEQREVLSKEAFAKKRKEFQDKVLGVQREVQTKRVQLEKAYAKALAEVEAVVKTIIHDLAKEKGFSIALPAVGTLYYNTKQDISDDVLKELDKRLPKVNVKL